MSQRTIDEAIKHCEEVADKCEKGIFYIPRELEKYAEEQRQLAELLKELKWWRTRYRGSCSACRYTTRNVFEEPCISCKPEGIDKWVCGYKGGETE